MNITWDAFPEPNITGFVQAMDYANSVTNNAFGIGIIISFWIISFLIFAKRGGEENAFIAANFITLVIAMLMRAMEAIGDQAVVILLILTGLSVLLLLRRKL